MNYYNYMYIHCPAHYGLILVIDYKKSRRDWFR